MIHPKAQKVNLVITVALITLALVVLFFMPEEQIFNPHSICIHYRLLGVQCPFCGMLRGVWSFLHGRWYAAFQLNYNVFLLALLYLVLVARIFIDRNWTKRLLRVVFFAALAGFLLIYLYRIWEVTG